MNGPEYELQVAAVAALKASAELRALIGDHLYQHVPPSPVFPYVTIGEAENLPDLAECIDGSEIFMTMHVFTRQNGIDYGPNKKIVAAMNAALITDLTLADYRCIEMQRSRASYFVESDNATVHGVAVYRAMVEPV